MIEDAYLKLTPRERTELLDSISRERGLAPAVLEKDYWVCQTLHHLFTLPGLSEHLVFKGGTSLSKVYGLIERFSEDIDISFHRSFLGFGDDRDPECASGKERSRRLNALQRACETCIRESLLPSLHASIAGQLGSAADWSLRLDPQDPQTLLFQFPVADISRPGYLLPSVRIELGARSDHWPSESHNILSYIGEGIGQPLGQATVRALAAERTFWEKATLLHAEAHRATEQPMPARYARHYYDLARLATTPVADHALQDTTLRQRVVAHKSVYFRSAWARYDLAEPASFRLLPPEARLPALAADHRAMQPMFFTQPPSIKSILETLAALESRIQALPS